MSLVDALEDLASLQLRDIEHGEQLMNEVISQQSELAAQIRETTSTMQILSQRHHSNDISIADYNTSMQDARARYVSAIEAMSELSNRLIVIGHKMHALAVPLHERVPVMTRRRGGLFHLVVPAFLIPPIEGALDNLRGSSARIGAQQEDGKAYCLSSTGGAMVFYERH